MHSLNPTLYDTSYSSTFLALSILPSLFLPLPFSSCISLPPLPLYAFYKKDQRSSGLWLYVLDEAIAVLFVFPIYNAVSCLCFSEGTGNKTLGVIWVKSQSQVGSVVRSSWIWGPLLLRWDPLSELWYITEIFPSSLLWPKLPWKFSFHYSTILMTFF